MNILRRKGKLTVFTDKQGIKTTMEDYETDNDIPHSESVDKLTITLSMIFVVYMFVYLFMMAMNSLHLGNLWENSIKPLIWGFNFFWGILFASLMKMIVKFLRKCEIMHREYLNDYLLNRSSGFFFDIMIVAGTAAISFENLKSFILPLLLVCLLGAIATFIYINWVCKELYKGRFRLPPSCRSLRQKAPVQGAESHAQRKRKCHCSVRQYPPQCHCRNEC